MSSKPPAKRKSYLYDRIPSKVIGFEFTREYSSLIDRFLSDIASRAAKLTGTESFALLAVGGYGRRELCPHSDIDVLLVHHDPETVAELAEQLWYPIWDEGLTLGHSVVEPEQLAELIAEDFEWSTSILDGRFIAGDRTIADEAIAAGRAWWAAETESKLMDLAETVKARQKKFGDAAFQIEPELKNGRGGLRDIHALTWAEKVSPGFALDHLGQLRADWETLVSARVELHRAARGASNKLTFDRQDDIFSTLGDSSAADLMYRIARSSRRLGWYSDDAWRRWKSNHSDTCATLDLTDQEHEFECLNGTLAIRPDVDVTKPPCLILKLARLAAQNRMAMHRPTLERLAAHSISLPNPWNDESRSEFVELFAAGSSTVRVMEDLEHYGLMEQILPEWSAVRYKPQRNALHTYTVDRHLVETAMQASRIYEEASPERQKRIKRLDLLIVGALLHDIGKGFEGDHTEVGVELISVIAERMGFDENDVDVLVDLCRHHLLLPDVATRRDLKDPSTTSLVAAAVDNIDFLHLLHAMTEADSISTGPSVWGSWKADLLNELVDRTATALTSGEYSIDYDDDFPDAELLSIMRGGDEVVRGKGEVFTIARNNMPNLFSLMAGVMAVESLKILRASSASVYTDKDAENPAGLSYCCRFEIQRPSWGEIDWDEVAATADAVLAGKLAISPRLGAKKRDYAKSRRRISAEPPRRKIEIDNTGSDSATIIEVHTRSVLGLLYSLTSGLRDLDVEINHAQVHTFGPQMVNTFYLTTSKGHKIADESLLNEVRLAIDHILNRVLY